MVTGRELLHNHHAPHSHKSYIRNLWTTYADEEFSATSIYHLPNSFPERFNEATRLACIHHCTIRFDQFDGDD